MAKTLSAPWILPAVQKALGVPGAAAANGAAGAAAGEGGCVRWLLHLHTSYPPI
jgi:hypothetical protein